MFSKAEAILRNGTEPDLHRCFFELVADLIQGYDYEFARRFIERYPEFKDEILRL